jgi:SAM-dependent methyltransferase
VPEAPGRAAGDPVAAWVEALQARHRRDLTFAEVRRGLQALSSLYVERRGRLAEGAALDGAGKRAAFALYYGPAHFLLVREIVRALGGHAARPDRIVDLGCGTGAAGAAWALAEGGTVEAVDRSGWAVGETRWTLAQLGLRGSARKGDAASAPLPARSGAVVAAFTVNELDPAARARLLVSMQEAADRGVRVLVVEPLARRALGWWDAWAAAFAGAGGRADEWRFDVAVPPSLVELGRAAGLDPGHLGGRSLFLPGSQQAVRPRRPPPQPAAL